MSEEERREGFLRRTIEPERVVASGGKPKKAKLTGKTIEGLRKSRPIIAKKIERYNEEYEKLISIAKEISDEQASETPDVEAIKDNVARFNAQAERLANLSVQIIAFNEESNKVSLNGVGVKAIRVPSKLTRILRSFTKAGRKKNEEYEEAMSSIKKSVTDIAKTAIDASGDEVTVDGDKLTSLGLTQDGSALTEVSDLTQGSLLDSVVRELRENHGYDVSVQDFLEDHPVEIVSREEGRRTVLDVLRERSAEREENEVRDSSVSTKTSKDILTIIEGSDTLFDAAKAIHEAGYAFALVEGRDFKAFRILDADKKPVKIEPEDKKVGEVVRLAALWGRKADGTEVEGAYSEEARPYFDELITRVHTKNIRGLSDDNIDFRNRVMDLVKSRSPLTQFILSRAERDFDDIKGIEYVEIAPEEPVVTAHEESVEARPISVSDETKKTLQESQAELSALASAISTLNAELAGLTEDSEEYSAKVAERDAKVRDLVTLTTRIIPTPGRTARREYPEADLEGEEVRLRPTARRRDNSVPDLSTEEFLFRPFVAEEEVSPEEVEAAPETDAERVRRAAAETARKSTVIGRKKGEYNQGLADALEGIQIASSTESEVEEVPKAVVAPEINLETSSTESDALDDEPEEEVSDEVRDDIAFWESITHVDDSGELAINDDVKILTPSEARREHHMEQYQETHADAIADQKRRREETREKQARTILMHCWPNGFEMTEEEVEGMMESYDCGSAVELLDRLKENAPNTYEEMQQSYDAYRKSQIQASLDRHAARQEAEGRKV